MTNAINTTKTTKILRGGGQPHKRYTKLAKFALLRQITPLCARIVSVINLTSKSTLNPTHKATPKTNPTNTKPSKILIASLLFPASFAHFAIAGLITEWQQPNVSGNQLLNNPYRIQLTGNALYYKLTGATTWVTKPNNASYISAVPNNWAEFVVVEGNMQSITLKRQNRPNTIQYFTGKFGGFNFRSGTTQNFTIEQDGELNAGFAGSGGLSQGFESGASLIVQSPATIMNLTNNGWIRTHTLIYGTIGTLTNTGNINDFRVERGGSITTFTMSGGLINLLSVNNGGKIDTLTMNNGAHINTFNINSGGTLNKLEKEGGTIGSISVSGFIDRLNNSGGDITTISLSKGGRINTLTLDKNGSIGNINIEVDSSLTTLQVDSGNIGNLNLNGGSLGQISGAGTIGYLNLNNFSIRLASPAGNWNKDNDTTKYNNKEHLYVSAQGPTITNITGKVTVSLAQGGKRDQVYAYNSIVTNSKGDNKFNDTNVVAAPGLFIKHNQTNKDDNKEGFSLSPDVSTSYGASILRSITLQYMRRYIMTQNILDSMTTKSFRASYKLEQEAEYKSLKDDMTRLTNRSSKYAKQKKRDQKQLDKVRDKLAKNTLRQSKGINLKKGYNNYELIDQLDKMFISYESERNKRAFILPYGAHSTTLGDSTSSTAEWAGGAIVGIQKNLQGKGVLGGYLGYEYANLDTKLPTTNITIQTNSLQAGLNLFKTYSFSQKPAEYYIKSSLHGSIELPNLSFIALGSTQNFKPFAYSAGADVRGGITAFFPKKNSYISPEIGLSYDMLSLNGFEIEPTNEIYKTHFWHFPMISASVKYYKSWKNSFKTSATIGAKYNIFHNLNKASFSYAGNPDTQAIALPPLYANIDLSAIWVLKKNSELSLNYTGVFFAGFSPKASNGVSTAFSLRFAHWF
ncbi:hypothetical protein [Helicobacter sp. T3_23-1059]